MRRSWALLFLMACGRAEQSALHSVGPQSARIEHLWWVFLGLLSAVYVAVLVVTAIALTRSGTSDATLARAVAAATGLTLVFLVVFLATSFTTGRAMKTFGQDSTLSIEVTGHQWWWEVTYQGKDPSEAFATANEIHIPVGRPVRLVLTSRDVIHSFWVPELHGKRDLIPGRRNELVIQADVAGVYRGQCAEFCGYQHAHMGLRVIAEPEAAWNDWAENQRKPAKEPATAQSRRGRDLFLSRPCVMCHAINGTDAHAINGPDLTHLMSRQTIGAATLTNTRGHLTAWILSAQSLKPGTTMPSIGLEASELEAILDFLGELR